MQASNVPQLIIREVERNNRNRRTFVQVSRDTCGENFSPGEDNRIFFGYQHTHPHEQPHTKQPIAVASVLPALPEDTHPSSNFRSRHYHMLTFLFVKRDFQQMGYGRHMTEHVQRVMTSSLPRPIRVQSAAKAVHFFEKLGYTAVGEPIECVCAGTFLFRTLQNMEKQVSS
uniref:N-acetyltransferase domain-containing protein n=1 Tax=Branchiostoma floridae TaxID=7739 RepID=C3ZCU1_BRAFL|eukprot:XP_002593583.1 hypothetical protein BRAFLDRAFT_88156 [Branchiostoma floridae]